MKTRFSERIRAVLERLRCPRCGEQNVAGRKPMIELTNGQAFCNKCSHAWIVTEGD